MTGNRLAGAVGLSGWGVKRVQRDGHLLLLLLVRLLFRSQRRLQVCGGEKTNTLSSSSCARVCVRLCLLRPLCKEDATAAVTAGKDIESGSFGIGYRGKEAVAGAPGTKPLSLSPCLFAPLPPLLSFMPQLCLLSQTQRWRQQDAWPSMVPHKENLVGTTGTLCVGSL